MAKGASYGDALTQADQVERRERRRVGDVRKATHQGKELPDAGAVHERLWKKLENGVSVWIVNGRLVGSAFDIDFTAGGWPYSTAHNELCRLEFRCRHHPDELHDALTSEGWA
jgi:hypothetical protein